MKTASSVLAILLALTLSAGIADAAKGAKNKPLAGTISKVEGAAITVTPRAKKNSTETAADVTVDTNDKTTVTVNGETKTVADLKAGDKVRVTLDADGKTATAITVGKAMAAPTTNP